MYRVAGLLAGAIGLAGCQASADKAARLVHNALPVLQPLPAHLPAPRLQDSIAGVAPHFAGRFLLTDSLRLDQPLPASGADWLQDFALMQAAQDSASLSTDGLELRVDAQHPRAYQRNVEPAARPYYPAQRVLPVYVLNTTARTKLLAGKDTWVFAIQEAQDRQGQWHPIESRGLDFCGNGQWVLKLHPQQVALFFVRQYQGPFATRLRVRLQNGLSRYVSAPYAGQIQESQFLVPADQLRQLRHMLVAKDWLYYGAEPAGQDSLEAALN